MDNVIHVNFGSPKNKEIAMENLLDLSEYMNSLSEYLDMLRDQGFDEDDIKDLVDAIDNVEVYLGCDEVIRELADAWFDRLK